MNKGIKYVHTNIVAEDWRTLARFYIDVFGCSIKPPERDLSGEWLDSLTGIENVQIRGVHLNLPGCPGGPTLEIFSYMPELKDSADKRINRTGLGHTAFHADDFESLVNSLLEHKGSLLGEIVTKKYENAGTLKVAYCRDPEGNFIEIQQWL